MKMKLNFWSETYTNINRIIFAYFTQLTPRGFFVYVSSLILIVVAIVNFKRDCCSTKSPTNALG